MQTFLYIFLNELFWNIDARIIIIRFPNQFEFSIYPKVISNRIKIILNILNPLNDIMTFCMTFFSTWNKGIYSKWLRHISVREDAEFGNVVEFHNLLNFSMSPFILSFYNYKKL